MEYKIYAVIMVYRPDDKLNLIIDRLRAQTVKPEKIVLMNTKDNVLYENVEKHRADSDILVVDVGIEDFDHAATRNRAMMICKDADFVMFMTQDAIPKNRCLVENLMKALVADVNNNAVAYARQEPYKECNIIERYTRGFNYSDEPHSGLELAAETNNGIKAIFCSNACAMYNRKLYDEIGGFPANAILNEDGVYAGKALKADKDVIYEPKAKVIHSHNYTGIQYFKRYFDIGVSHKEFDYIFGEYHTDDEGLELLKNTVSYLIRRKEYAMLLPLFYHSACKFLGLKLGKNYRYLPKEFIYKCTMNKNYWNKKGKG